MISAGMQVTARGEGVERHIHTHKHAQTRALARAHTHTQMVHARTRQLLRQLPEQRLNIQTRLGAGFDKENLLLCRVGLTLFAGDASFFLCVCVCVCVCARACVRACVRVWYVRMYVRI